jgi:hypothetical protein
MKMAKGYTKMQGTVEKAARNGKAFLIEDEWYSVYKAAQANGAEAGDYVEFEYESVLKGGQTFRNIQGSITVKGAAPKGSAGSTETSPKQEESQARYAAKDKAIVRQNMLRHATAIVLGLPVASLDDIVEDVIATARRLEEEYVLAE